MSEQQTPETLLNAERYEALREFLVVDRQEKGDWTCWLHLECIPFRSRTTNPDEIVDKLVAIRRERSHG